MDKYCTKDGLAKNRIPNDLTELPTQEGSNLDEVAFNSWTFELCNLIEATGETLDRNQENQLAIGIDKATVYNKVGQVKKWGCSKENIPPIYAVLDGSLLKPEDYEDGLAELKKRIPSWISGENVQFPNYNGYFSRFSSSRTLGSTQGDAMKKITFTLEADLTTPKKLKIEIPGRVSAVEYNAKGHGGHTKIHNLGKPSFLTPGRDTSDIAQRDDTGVTLPNNFTVELSKRVTQDGTVASENRPKNVGVIMAVVVGIPKIMMLQNE